MIPVLYKFRLDVAKMGSQACIYIKQGDVKSRQIQAFLHNGTAPYVVEDGAIVVFRARKPDGTTIYNECTVNGNVVNYLLTMQTAAAVGVVNCELAVYSADNQVLFAPEFDIVVTEPQVEDDDIISTNEFSALTRAQTEALEYRNKWSNPYAESASGDEAGAFISLEDAAVKFSFTLPRGKTPDISVGSVTALDETAVPFVELDENGTKDEPIFNFGIPAGKTGPSGDKGEPGTSFTVLSLYASLSELYAAHPVGDAGDAYAVGTNEDNTIYIWDVDATAWTEVGPLQGPEGPQGPPTMVNGKTGESITLDYTDVGAAAAEHEHAISDVTGLQDALDAKALASDVAASFTAVNAAIATKENKSTTATATLLASAWVADGEEYTQTVAVSGMTPDKNIVVGSHPNSNTAYKEAGVYCSEQDTDALVFKATDVPESDLVANILMIGG